MLATAAACALGLVAHGIHSHTPHPHVGVSLHLQAPQGAATHRATAVMAGGAPSKKKAKAKAQKKAPSGVTAKQSWDLFRELRSSDNVLTTSVFARLPEEGEKWLNVGGVIVEAPGSRTQAVNAHKRLILEHAARMHPKLAVRSRELVCGFIETGEAPGEVVPLDKCPAPPDLRAGFQGLPHVPSGMYILQGGIQGR
jgi:hypothetical protein